MGYITPEITGKFPGYLSPSAGLKFADVPNGLAAISKVPAAGWGQILAYMAFCEVSQDQSAGTPAAAGDFGFKVLTASDPEAKKTKLAAELANGRLAMMAIIGMFFQETLSNDFVYATRVYWWVPRVLGFSPLYRCNAYCVIHCGRRVSFLPSTFSSFRCCTAGQLCAMLEPSDMRAMKCVSHCCRHDMSSCFDTSTCLVMSQVYDIVHVENCMSCVVVL